MFKLTGTRKGKKYISKKKFKCKADALNYGYRKLASTPSGNIPKNPLTNIKAVKY